MKEVYIPSTNNRNQLHVAIWEPERETKAILQISHGMVEYIVRYDDFAKHLNQQGILVIGNDHLGHGQSVLDESEFGYFGKEKGSAVVDDLYEGRKHTIFSYGTQHGFLHGTQISYDIRREDYRSNYFRNRL